MAERRYGFTQTESGEEFPYLIVGGEKRLMARLPTPRDHMIRTAVPTWTQGVKAGQLPDIKFADIKPFSSVRTDVPILDQDGRGACVLPKTLIRMADGSQKAIEDVRCLGQVLTAEGNIGTVTETMVRKASAGLINLQLWGHSHLRMTPDHPVLTRRGYVAAGELKLDDYVAIPRYLPNAKSTLLTGEHIDRRRVHVSTDRQLRLMGVAGRKAVRPLVKAIPESIALNEGFGRIIGYFLAEGNTSRSRVEYTFGKHEETTFVAELIALLREELSIEAHSASRGNGAWKVKIFGAAWAELLETLCGSRVDVKSIHPDLAAGKRDFMEGVFRGWFNGDGSFKDVRRLRGASVSHTLAMNMYDIANALGYRPSIQLRQSQQHGGGAKSRRPAWCLDMAKNQEKAVSSDGDSYRSIQDDKTLWRKVRGITSEDYDGYVFNLEVEGDHSYVAEGVGVHNCLPHAWTTAMMLARAVSGAGFTKLSPWFLYSLINGGRDAGSNAGDAYQALTTTGICPDALVPYATIRPAGYNADAKTAAARFKIQTAYQIQGFEQAVIAAALGYGITFDLHAGMGFDVDSSGICAYCYGLGNNHEVFAGEQYALINGKPYIGGRNSWGTQWGVQGRCYWQPKHLDNSDETYAVTLVSADPQDPNALPTVP